MITLRNIKKTYKTKKGRPFEALKGVSLALPERGMVFLLGRSGSGKTTLLNIIGLLDRPTEGTVEVDGAVLQEKGLDNFRNRFSGFVFQEFALLEEETVGQNVALALRLQNTRETDAQVAEALARVGLEGYEGRYPYELSGGEKQRVAIARAIVKRSEMILADEPTGNLDSENGEEIFEILKSLSAEKLVVVVSHDKGFAEKYADRIVSLKDGLIVSDTAPLPIPEAAPSEEASEAPSEALTEGAPQPVEAEKREEEAKVEALGVKAHLPTLLAFRMGWRNFGQKKVKSAITFILAAFAMTVLVFSQVFFSFDAERAIAKTVKENDLKALTLVQRNTPKSFSGYTSSWREFHDGDFGEALGNIPYLAEYRFGDYRDGAVIEGVQDIEKMGFTLYDGAQEITDDSVYVSDDFIEQYIYRSVREVRWLYGDVDLTDNEVSGLVDAYVREGEELVPLDPEVYDYASLVGKTVALRNSYGHLLPFAEFRVAGVVETNFKEFYIYPERGYGEGTIVPYEEYVEKQGKDDFHNEALYEAHMDYWRLYGCPSCFFTRTFANRNQESIGFSDDVYDPYDLTLATTAVSMKFDSLNLAHINRSGSNDRIIMEGSSTAVYPADVTLNEGEIILGERAYNNLYDNELSCASCLNGDTVLRTPKRLGNTVRLKIGHDGEGLIEREFRIVGVKMSAMDEGEQAKVYGTVYLGDADMETSAQVGLRPIRANVRTAGVGELKLRSALRALRYDHALATQFEYSEYVYGAEYYQEAVGLAFLAVGLIMMLVTILIVVSLISYNILAQRREIGILRALGARSVDVSKIYLAQAVILSAVTLLLSMALSLILISVFNSTIAANLLYGLILIGYTPLTWFVLFAGSFGAMLLGTALPLRKISRIQPAEAIKKG